MTTNPVIALTLDAVPDPDAGAASGVLMTTTQLANILGVTVIGSLYFVLLGTVGDFSRALDWSLLPLAVLFSGLLFVLPRLRGATWSRSPAGWCCRRRPCATASPTC